LLAKKQERGFDIVGILAKRIYAFADHGQKMMLGRLAGAKPFQ
jgi:hypothetical protein